MRVAAVDAVAVAEVTSHGLCCRLWRVIRVVPAKEVGRCRGLVALVDSIALGVGCLASQEALHAVTTLGVGQTDVVEEIKVTIANPDMDADKWLPKVHVVEFEAFRLTVAHMTDDKVVVAGRRPRFKGHHFGWFADERVALEGDDLMVGQDDKIVSMRFY